MPDPTLPPILHWSATLAHDRRHDDEFAPGVIAEMPDSGLFFAATDEGWSVLNEVPSDARRVVVDRGEPDIAEHVDPARWHDEAFREGWDAALAAARPDGADTERDVAEAVRWFRDRTGAVDGLALGDTGPETMAHAAVLVRAALDPSHREGDESAATEKRWNDAVDWLLNSRHTADPHIQGPFWAHVDGLITLEDLDADNAAERAHHADQQDGGDTCG